MVGEIQGQRWRCCSSFGTRGTARSIVDWWATTYAIFSWGNGSLLEKACSGCRRKRSHQLHDWDSEHRSHGRGSCFVGQWRKEATRFVVRGVRCEPQLFPDRRRCWQGECSRYLDHRGGAICSLQIRKASLRVFSSLPLAIVKAWTAYVQSRQPDRHCKIADVGGELNPHWSQVTLDDDWYAVCE